MRTWKKSRRITRVDLRRRSVYCHAVQTLSSLRYLRHGLQLLSDPSQTSVSLVSRVLSAMLHEAQALGHYGHQMARLQLRRETSTPGRSMCQLMAIVRVPGRKNLRRGYWTMDLHRTAARLSSRAYTAFRMPAYPDARRPTYICEGPAHRM
jgi:hypothetical protein